MTGWSCWHSWRTLELGSYLESTFYNQHPSWTVLIVVGESKTFKMNKIIFLCALIGIISVAFAETCQKPEIVASSYVTEDATVLTNVAFTMQFILKCSNGVKGISLYAEVEGKTLPAVRLSADNKYQVMFTYTFLTLLILTLKNWIWGTSELNKYYKLKDN